jgi:hypothetical protein
MSQFIRNNIKS